tara:strand:- start:164 stop:472 length:309 start_codon:yes stop_codon:yes gene_type:complete
MGKRWTDKEDGILETLRDGGMTYKEIASIMGRTSTAIHQRAYVLRHNEPTFREVVDTAFAKHEIEFGEPDKPLPKIQHMINQMERDIKPKPQWWKAMMWWRK